MLSVVGPSQSSIGHSSVSVSANLKASSQAKRRGVYRGQHRSLDPDAQVQLSHRALAGMSKSRRAVEYGISRQSLYRSLRDAEDRQQPSGSRRTGTESPDTLPVVGHRPSSGAKDPETTRQTIRVLPCESERAWQRRVLLRSSSLRGKRQSGRALPSCGDSIPANGEDGTAWWFIDALPAGPLRCHHPARNRPYHCKPQACSGTRAFGAVPFVLLPALRVHRISTN